MSELRKHDAWKTTEPDPDPWNAPDNFESCPSCGALPDDPCTQHCECIYCTRERLRTLDIDPEGEAA